MNKAPTIVDIARKMGISPISVSRALRNAGHVSKALREKILQEAKRIGYQPNTAARALRSNSSFLIGLIVPSFFSHQIDELVTNIQHHAQEYDHGLIFGLTQWDTKTELKQLEFMANKKVDGIIIKSRGQQQVVEKIKQLIKSGIKVVCLLDKYECDACSVLVDNAYGGSLAAKHLIKNGHKKVCYITYKLAKSLSYSVTHFSNERLSGFKREYEKNNIPLNDNITLYIDTQPDAPFSIKPFEVLLDHIKNYSAVFTYDDYIAAGVLNLLQQHGIKVPNECSIIGFDDSPLVSHWSNPPITVIKQPDGALGFEATNLILGKNEDSMANNNGDNIYIVKPKLVSRESVKDISLK
ncbi:MAG: LacI family transcriptional regulator [Planctomycetaceae bacterium]|nr:LacI family transcriptional regulator [Planctomycetaceae bacterium]